MPKVMQKYFTRMRAATQQNCRRQPEQRGSHTTDKKKPPCRGVSMKLPPRNAHRIILPAPRRAKASAEIPVPVLGCCPSPKNISWDQRERSEVSRGEETVPSQSVCYSTETRSHHPAHVIRRGLDSLLCHPAPLGHPKYISKPCQICFALL